MKNESTTPIKIWSTKFHLDVFNVNHNGRADFKTYFNFMQESALKHAHHLGFGSSDLLEKNLLWVVTRFELHVFHKLAWDSEVEVITWSRGMIGPYAFRDFQIKNQNGDLVALASSSWIPIDVEKRKSVILKPTDLPNETSHEESVGIEPQKVLYRPIESELINTFKVRNSDLDINRHVNNTKYIQWIYDSLTLEEIDNLKSQKFSINYNNEAKLGDIINLYRKENIFLAKNDQGQVIFSALMD